MAAGWVTVLQMVPWGEVIKNAPKVADGAVKLWSSVTKKKVYDETGSEVGSVVLATDIDTIEKLEHRLQAAEQTIADLQDILANPERVKTIIKDELAAAGKTFGEKRKSEISYDESEINIADLIAKD